MTAPGESAPNLGAGRERLHSSAPACEKNCDWPGRGPLLAFEQTP